MHRKLPKICTRCGGYGPFGEHKCWCLGCLKEAAKKRREKVTWREIYEAMPLQPDGSICARCNKPGRFERGRRTCKTCRAEDRRRTNTMEITRTVRERMFVKAPWKRKLYQETRKRSPRYRQSKLEQHLKRYGLSTADFTAMFEKQNGLCAICKQPETQKLKSRTKRLAVDHCHNTQRIRGLLCHACNAGLGYFKDSIELLKAAIRYLRLAKRRNPSPQPKAPRRQTKRSRAKSYLPRSRTVGRPHA